MDILGDIELVEGDLRSIDSCRRAMKGARFVFHQAALPSVPRSIEDPHATQEVSYRKSRLEEEARKHYDANGS